MQHRHRRTAPPVNCVIRIAIETIRAGAITAIRTPAASRDVLATDSNCVITVASVIRTFAAIDPPSVQSPPPSAPSAPLPPSQPSASLPPFEPSAPRPSNASMPPTAPSAPLLPTAPFAQQPSAPSRPVPLPPTAFSLAYIFVVNRCRLDK